MKSLKTMLRQAHKEGRIPITHQPFATIKLKRERAIKEKISTEEVRRIARLPLAEGSLLGIIRDTWMFSFYAGGMRFGDVATMRRRHVQVSTEDGTEVVRSLYRMGKTENIHGVLLVEKAVEILDRYGWREKAPDDLLTSSRDSFQSLA